MQEVAALRKKYDEVTYSPFAFSGWNFAISQLCKRYLCCLFTFLLLQLVAFTVQLTAQRDVLMSDLEKTYLSLRLFDACSDCMLLSAVIVMFSLTANLLASYCKRQVPMLCGPRS